MTTRPLERAFTEAAKLPDRDQDALAALVMEELESEKKWDNAFADLQDMLARMSEQALAEHKTGETRPLDVDALSFSTRPKDFGSCMRSCPNRSSAKQKPHIVNSSKTRIRLASIQASP